MGHKKYRNRRKLEDGWQSFEMLNNEQEILALLADIKQACKNAPSGAEMHEFVILCQLPSSGKRVTMIEGVAPAGYRPFTGASRKAAS